MKSEQFPLPDRQRSSPQVILAEDMQKHHYRPDRNSTESRQRGSDQDMTARWI